MKKDHVELIVGVIALILALSIFPWGRMMGYGSGWGLCGMMGNWNYGSGGYGFGMLISWVTNIAVLVFILLGIVWLVKQIRTRRK